MITPQLFNNKARLAISTLKDGNMRAFSEMEFDEVLKNQQKLCDMLGVSAHNTARVLTTYINRKSFSEYYEINADTISKHTILKPESELKLADGLVTKSKDFTLLLPLADCLGIIIYDKTNNILGLLHSGRQNLEEEGAYRFVDFLKQYYNSQPEDLQVFFTPHALDFRIYALDNKRLAEAAAEQLLRAGVKAKNIKRLNINTVTDPDFPSHSAGDKTTRFAVAVKLNS